MAFTYSLNIALYNKDDTVSLDEVWFHIQIEIINNHFDVEESLGYKVVVKLLQKRFYFNTLEQKPSKLNIRNFLVQDHFKIDFSNDKKMWLEYSYLPYSYDAIESVYETGSTQITAQNKIYYGAPGTGKSYKINELLKGRKDRVKIVTFHPEYDYTSYVGGFKPITEDTEGKEDIKYKFVPQIFTNIYVDAWNDIENDYLSSLGTLSQIL